MVLPFLIFWVIIFIAKKELGCNGVILCIAIWLMLLLGFFYLGISPYYFVTAQALFDVILILVAFGGDIRIR